MAKGLLSVLDQPVDTKVVDRNGNVRTFPFGRTPVMFSYNPALDVAFTHGRVPGVNGHNYEPVLVYHRSADRIHCCTGGSYLFVYVYV